MSFGVLVLLVVVGTTIWVGYDASRRDWQGGTGVVGWVVGCVLLWLVFFPMYLVKRGKAPLKDEARSAATPTEMYRECPHCKEPMRRDADTCPHCRNSSIAWQFHDNRWWYRSSEDDPWHWLDERTNSWVALEQTAQSPAEAT